MIDNDFVAVKMGDINGNAITQLNGSPSVERRGAPVELLMEDIQFEAGDIITLPVSLNRNMQATGLQMNLDIDTEMIEFIAIDGGVMNIEAEHLNLTQAAIGRLPMSWVDARARYTAEGEDIFTIQLRAKTNGSIAQAINLHNDLNAEIYDEALNEYDLEITYRSTVEDTPQSILVSKNTPNPFSEYTDISVTVATPGQVNISVMDLTGKLVWNQGLYLDAGVHNIRIDADRLNAAGLLYYTVEKDGVIFSDKMMLVK